MTSEPMTLRGYYGLIFKRGLGGSWGLTERIELALGVVAGALQFFYPPVRYPIVGTVLAILWVVPAALLVWTIGKALVLAPYKVYFETLAQIPNPDRAAIREDLAEYLLNGQIFFEAVNLPMFIHQREEIQGWLHAVERYIADTLGPSELARFRQSSRLDLGVRGVMDPRLQRDALRVRCDYLADLIREYSKEPS
jgi:hypothetical protein